MTKADESSTKGEERAVLPNRASTQQRPRKNKPSVGGTSAKKSKVHGDQRREMVIEKQEKVLQQNARPTPPPPPPRTTSANKRDPANSSPNTKKTDVPTKPLTDDSSTTHRRENLKAPENEEDDAASTSSPLNIRLPAPLQARPGNNPPGEILPGAFRMRPSVEPTPANGLAEGEQEESRRSILSSGNRFKQPSEMLIEATLVDQELPPTLATTSYNSTNDESRSSVPAATSTHQQPLAVIPEPELVMGQPMNTKEMDAWKQSNRRWRCIVLGLISFLFVFLLVLGIVLGVMLTKKEPTVSEQETSPQTTSGQEETTGPTMAPTAFEASVLPWYTQEAIKDPNSPQALAFEWVEKDLEQYSLESDNFDTEFYFPLQRMVLATVYYALGGPQWTKQDRWLEQGTDPCDWYTPYYGSICTDATRNRRHATRQLRQRLAMEESGRRYYHQLSLFKNNLVGTLPPEIGLLSKLDVFNLHGNSITGSIPSETGLWRQVTFLQLFNNSLTGTIPSQLGQLEKIWHLNFAFNQLSGAIPTELSRLSSSLQILSISNNRITGVVPTEFGALTELKGLHLYANSELGGALPTELGLLVKMEEMQFQNTSIHGLLPSELGLLSKLTKLALHDTELSGVLPREVCALVSSGALPEITVDCERVTCLDCACDCSKSMSNVNGGTTSASDVPLGAGELVTDAPIQLSETVLPDTETPSSSIAFTSAEVP